MIDPSIISRFKKEKFLRELSEDDFRDLVVRPVFLKSGFKDGRDFCGADEEGKDCLFVETNSLGQNLFYVVQTKKGTLNMTKKASSNITTAVTQLKTALATRITLTETKQKVFSNFAMLCASGKINDKARRYICEEVNDTRILFSDIDSLIPMIDKSYPELWYGIDAHKMPYLRSLKNSLIQFNENMVLSDSISINQKLTAVTNEIYVPLKVSFTSYRLRRHKGQTLREPKIEEIPAEVLLASKKNLILILGDAGAGKSTILRRIAFICCEQSISQEKQLTIPILLRAMDVYKSEKTLIDICAEETQRIAAAKSACFTAEDLSQGRVVVLIDALDEVADENERKKILANIDSFVNTYQNCKVLLTSRDYTYLKDLKELTRYEDFRLTSFSLNQAKIMVEKLIKGKSLPKEAIQEIVRKIQGVHGVDLSPLLVTVFVATSDISRKDIPANITELFKKYTEMMLGRWDISKGLSQQYQFPVKDFLLKKMAYEMHSRRATFITEKECLSIFDSELKKIGRKEAEISVLIKEVVHRSGLFRCFNDKIEFRHLLLQEFFAGRGIPSPELLSGLITKQWWQRAIIFYFGENPGESKTLNMVVDKLITLTPRERFQASVTAGLSLQACYLVQVTTKLEFFKWVIKGLSVVKMDLLSNHGTTEQRYPLTQFILYYLFGRDSVASDILEDHSGKIIDDVIKTEVDEEQKEMLMFWLIVGLIEGGFIANAERLLKGFKPKDTRLLLALHLGCYYIEKLRVSTNEQKEIANRICAQIAPKIANLRLKLIDEFKSELLEVQQGEVKSLDKKV
ncbi:MAG: NACHT domain-containing protein [Candidatus Omnitrophica bacterium]|nr:NACHT domain-containing protein [Candidatus Omnitrophota bacterium]